MDFQLKPVTDAGRRFVEIAEKHAAVFASRAAEHDQTGTFPFENIEDMKRSGLIAATVPQAFGGLGVESIHDFATGISRLGRGDGSTAIGITMHLFRPWRTTRMLKAAQASGQSDRVNALESLLTNMGKGETIYAALLSEAGTDLVHPNLEATKTDGGWLLNGTKIFATMSEAATVFEATCRVKDENGEYQRAIATVPATSDGISSRMDWNALGMRSSGSHTVDFADCFIPESALIIAGPLGVWNAPILASTGVINLCLTSVFLGIAEAARSHVIDLIGTRYRGSDGTPLAQSVSIQNSVAYMETKLSSSRALLSRTLLFADDLFSIYDDVSMPFDDLKHLAKEIQITKQYVSQQAVKIVDDAMTLSGGSGYIESNLIARLYRDVRAGLFMQPFSPNEAYEFIGKISLGLDI